MNLAIRSLDLLVASSISSLVQYALSVPLYVSTNVRAIG